MAATDISMYQCKWLRHLTVLFRSNWSALWHENIKCIKLRVYSVLFSALRFSDRERSTKPPQCSVKSLNPIKYSGQLLAYRWHMSGFTIDVSFSTDDLKSFKTDDLFNFQTPRILQSQIRTLTKVSKSSQQLRFFFWRNFQSCRGHLWRSFCRQVRACNQNHENTSTCSFFKRKFTSQNPPVEKHTLKQTEKKEFTQKLLHQWWANLILYLCNIHDIFVCERAVLAPGVSLFSVY